MKKTFISIPVLVVLLAGGYIALAGDRPAEDAKPLSAIAKIVEAKGYVIAKADNEKGVWEIDAFRGAEEFDLRVDGKTGEILSEKPD